MPKIRRMRSMAAYAALVSLFNIMEQIQTHPRHSFSFDNKQIQSLREKVDFLLDFIENYSHGAFQEAEALESQISSAAQAAEDAIESHVVDQIHDGSSVNGETSSCFLFDLQEVIEDMDAIKVKARRGFRDKLSTYSRPAASSTGNNFMVGFDDELIQLMERLTGPHHNRQIIPIVGMGGIGKTTLARNVYQHLLIVQHFDVRLWATISQEYSNEQILFELFSCLGNSTSETTHKLGEQLHKTLSGRRYLVVLDDMWSNEAWDKIQLFLPDNDNGSRIIITTRQANMAIHLSSSSFVMNFLDGSKSWKLFCGMAFGDEGCPTALEVIGKKIAKNCQGLPLSIVVIGGHLRRSSRAQEYWEEVANDINSILNSGDDEQCLNILSMSYRYLPVYLKPCFLHMGLLPEYKEIRVSKLIKLWVAEGFLKPNKHQSFEEVAEGYLGDLVDRNLVFVQKRSCIGKIETCNIHDLLKELCLRVAKKEKFFYVLNTPRAIHTERRIVIQEGVIRRKRHNPEVFRALRSARLVRSLNWEVGSLKRERCDLSLDLRLLRVLNRVEGMMDAFNLPPLDAYFQLVNLRYLDYCHLDNWFGTLYLPSSISRLWNLQTLIFTESYCNIIAPPEIWEMPQLRHLDSNMICLPDPRPSGRLHQQDDFILRNLHTLLIVENFRLSDEVCKRIPNIRLLGISYLDFSSECGASSYYCPCNFGLFHKLESLHLYFSEEPNWRGFALSLTFPSSLRELSLTNCFLQWEELTMIGSLPHLEVLRLIDRSSVIGPEWNPVEGEFLGLKSLEMLVCCDLISWNADSSHFPVLEKLVLVGMWELDEIPSGFGEIPTLGIIDLHDCSVSAAFSALKVLVEQESLGNEGLQLQVHFSKSEEWKSFREMMQLEGLTSNNIRVK